MTMSKVQVIGNVGSANIRTVQTRNGSQTVLDVSVAANIKMGGEERTVWYRFSLWGNYAVTMVEYLVKGKQIFVEGTLLPRAYTRNDGTQGLSLEIHRAEVKLLGGRRNQADETLDEVPEETYPPLPEEYRTNSSSDLSSIPF